MPIRFSDHARYQIRDRKLSKVLVGRVVQDPDKIFRQSDGRMRAVKKIIWTGKPYALVIVYEKERGDLVIVTVFRTSKIKKYL